MLMPTRYDASATVSPARQSTKRVTPSSKLSAMRWVMIRRSASNVVDVDDVVDVVVLQHDLLAPDQRRSAGIVDRVIGRAEIGVRGLVAEAVGHPVEPQLDQAAGVVLDLGIGNVVRGARRRQAGGAPARRAD